MVKDVDVIAVEKATDFMQTRGIKLIHPLLSFAHDGFIYFGHMG